MKQGKKNEPAINVDELLEDNLTKKNALIKIVEKINTQNFKKNQKSKS